MSWTLEDLGPELMDELGILIRYDLSSAFVGLRIHSTAGPRQIGAAQRLYRKGLISEPDGGYLTTRGWKAAEYAQSLFSMMVVDETEAAFSAAC